MGERSSPNIRTLITEEGRKGNGIRKRNTDDLANISATSSPSVGKRNRKFLSCDSGYHSKGTVEAEAYRVIICV